MNIKTKEITLAAIFAAIYAILGALSVYLLDILSIFFVIITPIFAAYYATTYRIKSIILFNLTTIVVSFLACIGDPFFIVLYIIPSLLIGNLFGLFNKLQIKYYTTMFLQAITFSIINILTIILAEWFYETNIFKTIIQDTWTYEHLGFIILFILSAAEASVSCIFVSEQLKKLGINKEKEKEMPFYGNITIIGVFLLAIIFTFINRNMANLCVFIALFLGIINYILIIRVYKYRYFFTALLVFSILIPCFIFAYFALYGFVPLMAVLPFVVLPIVKTIIYIYNINKKEVNEYE